MYNKRELFIDLFCVPVFASPIQFFLDMANFYAEVKNLINGCDISFIEPLSYMKHFSTTQNPNATNATEKIVLLYKKVSIRLI